MRMRKSFSFLCLKGGETMKHRFKRKKNNFKEFSNLCPKSKIPQVRKINYHRRSAKKRDK
jgi:O-acetylhomoserine/O-acetylserine sulfhydrylase-like pyridoxal-dependent enzyme